MSTKNKVDIIDYNYIMFVDASGDDGYKFKETSSDGSSYSFVVSCFVTTPEELEYNKSVLLNMKNALPIKPEQELKSTALKRHRNAESAYQCMKELHGFAYSLIADKRLLHNSPAQPKGISPALTIYARYDLSGTTHTFPYFSMTNSNIISPDDKVLIIIDNMKKREMESIRNRLSIEGTRDYDVIFRDSKDKDFPLIQIADIMAGTIRNYYENCLPLKTHNFMCKNCMQTANKRRKPIAITQIAFCKTKHGRKSFVPYITNRNFNIVLYFHQLEKSKSPLGEHLLILPADQLYSFFYLQCLVLQKNI